ncbi:MAG: hypothetical protein LRY71_02450 [Bacillaceae bacterium]|nr:hypothetical protein [Bacillaceae bacterium]
MINEDTHKKSNETLQEAEKMLYENDHTGIRIGDVEGFILKQEGDKTVTFTNETVTAIISVLETGRTKEEIKDELLKGIGNVTFIEETDKYIAWKSDRNESIRTDVYLKENKQYSVLVVFMTPMKDYQQNSNKIKTFLDRIILE